MGLATPQSGREPSILSGPSAQQPDSVKAPKAVKATGGSSKTAAATLSAAYGDSDERTPILLLLTGTVDTQGLVTDFHRTDGPPGRKEGEHRVVYCPLYRGAAEKKVTATVEQSIQDGNWVVLDHLHLVPEWLSKLEGLLGGWKGKSTPDVNPNFRLWISCVPLQSFPISILQSSVKVAVQQSQTVRDQCAGMLQAKGYISKESFFKGPCLTGSSLADKS